MRSFECVLRLNPFTPPAAAAAAHSPELSRELMKLRIHLRNKFQKQIAQWRREQGTRSDGDMRSIQELVRTAVASSGWGTNGDESG